MSRSDFLKLHLVVILFGFTGIFGKLVSIPAVEMVFFRTLFAMAGLLLIIPVTGGSLRISKADALRLVATGWVVAVHWISFFLSGRIANVAVSLVGFATASLWTALLEPFMKREQPRALEMIFALVVLIALYLIFSADMSYSAGLLLGVLSGITCAFFSIVNSMVVTRVRPLTITFYEMIGACSAIALFFPVYLKFWSPTGSLELIPKGWDWLWIILLAWLCTIFAYSISVDLVKRISVFLFQLTLNLEPIYGILMALLIFGESEKMSPGFYAGTLLLLLSVFSYPWVKSRLTAGRPIR